MGLLEVIGAADRRPDLRAVFIWLEGRVPEPLLPLSLFRMRTFAVSSLAALGIGGVLFGISIYVPVYMQGVLGASATSSGVVLIPLTSAGSSPRSSAASSSQGPAATASSR